MFTGNPNHPVARESAQQWHKLCALLMHKQGLREMEITSDDISRLEQAGLHIGLDARNNQLKLRLLTEAEARELIKKEGGLPY